MNGIPRNLKKTFALLTMIIGALTSQLCHAQSCLYGDDDRDTDIDLNDVAFFFTCFSEDLGSVPSECSALDGGDDGAIDLDDYALIVRGMTGPLAGLPFVSLDVADSPTADQMVTVSGTAYRACSVSITGGVQPVSVSVVDGSFLAPVELAANRINDLFVTAIAADGTPGAPSPISITHDQTPPTVFIDFPPQDAELTGDSTDVAGRVSDLLSGFMGLTVTVNGVPADVDVGIGTNGTFLATHVPLSLGENTITAVAEDELGNEKTAEITVLYVEIPSDAPQMAVLSGNNQTTQVESLLSEPIAVRVVNEADGIPFPNKIVNFAVTRSNGLLKESMGAEGGGTSLLQVRTDADGMARAWWRLGTDAGCGNNRVTVTSKSIAGSIFYCATATPRPAAQINIGSGNNQRAEAGGPACEPLRAWVNDACNGVADVPVTFTVVQGDGLVNGASEVTISTSRTGHAQVDLRLGPLAGNNIVAADFPGNPGAPATFVVAGVARDEAASTSFEALILTNAGQPIQDATCTLDVGGFSESIASDLDGRCRFEPVGEVGVGHLFVNGLTATHVGGVGGDDVPLGSFPTLTFGTVLVPNAANKLPMPVRLPPLNPNNVVEYSLTEDTILTVEEIDGLKMTVKRGSMWIDGLPAPAGTIMTLNQVHHDDVPMPMPDGAAPPFAWTLQPSGAIFDPPVEIVYPNMSGLAPGSVAFFLSFVHETEEFEIVATGTVTSDGSCIVSDPGAGLTVAGWGCNCPPYSVSGSCCKCDECSQCTGGSCQSACNGSEFCCAGQCCTGRCCNGEICCAPDTTCCKGSESGEFDCVPGDEVVCSDGTCCESGSMCCGDDPTMCCQAGTTCCRGTESGEFDCVPGDNEMCGDGTCCDGASTCCGDGQALCCGEDTTCCKSASSGLSSCVSGDSDQCSDGTCCGSGTMCCGNECFDPGIGVCCLEDVPVATCPLGFPCCDGVCCALDSVCCGNTCIPREFECCGDHRCFPGDTCCGDDCCILGNLCCDGTCCEHTAACCDGACCELDTFCCGNTCCPNGEACCFGRCCPADFICCLDTCCVPGQECCRNQCCEFDETCCNGTCCSGDRICCGDRSCCLADQCNAKGFCCIPPLISCGNDCCDSNLCTGNGFCCATGTTVCGDACCGSTQTCCEGQCCAPGLTCVAGVCQ